MKGLTTGRIVHFVMDDGRGQGEHRPAIVTQVWNEDGLVNLTVFHDGENDYARGTEPVSSTPTSVRKTSRYFDDDGKVPGTWHWIEQA